MKRITESLFPLDEQVFETVIKNDADKLKGLLSSGWFFFHKTRHLDSWNSGGDTLLTLAVRNGNTAIIDILLEGKADINAPDRNGHTPLHTAIFSNNLELVKYLVSKGANVMKPTRDSRTPLWLAVVNNQADIIKFLKSRGAI